MPQKTTPAASAPAPQQVTQPRVPSARKTALLDISFAISIAITVAALVVFCIYFSWDFDKESTLTHVLGILYIVLLAADATGCMTMVVFDFETHMKQARVVARATMVALLATAVVGLMIKGVDLVNLVFLFQFVCLIAFQTATDASIARNRTFTAPWHVSSDPTRTDYIPLNFFNLFWVFLIASVLGLIVEEVYFALVFDAYPDRAGLLRGPFSPIYGFGAVLMTVALNRYWNRNIFLIFGVSGLIGAAFEFAVSWFMETAFGIIAWDYSGTFLNIQGRTNFAFFCAWGFLGLMWVKVFLPSVLRLVDAIPIRWRIALTSIFAVFMIADGLMTLITVDCWYQREAGQAPQTTIEQFCANHFDDDFMAQRFQSMDMDPSRAQRVEDPRP